MRILHLDHVTFGEQVYMWKLHLYHSSKAHQCARDKSTAVYACGVNIVRR